MIKTLITCFYTLSLDKSFTIIFVFTYIIMFINSVLENKKIKKAIYFCIFFLSLAVIMYITVISRTDSDIESISFIPFSSYISVVNGANPEILRSNYMNVLLFYPLGLSSALLLEKKRRFIIAIIITILFSCGIEGTQFVFLLGYVEIDDVIHNFLGFILGFIAVKGLNLYFKNF